MLNLKTFSKLLIMDTPPQNICQYCGKSSKDFSQGKLFLEHVRRHESIEADCDQCGKRWPTKKALSDHKRDVHSEGYPCACCNRKWPEFSAWCRSINLVRDPYNNKDYNRNNCNKLLNICALLISMPQIYETILC